MEATKPATMLTTSGGFGRGDSESVVYEAGDQVEPSAERFHIAGDGVDRGELAPLDLGDPAGGDAHRLGELGLGQAVTLAFPGEAETGLAGHQLLAAPLSCFGTAGPFDVGGTIPLGIAPHRPASSSARSFR